MDRMFTFLLKDKELAKLKKLLAKKDRQLKNATQVEESQEESEEESEEESAEVDAR